MNPSKYLFPIYCVIILKPMLESDKDHLKRQQLLFEQAKNSFSLKQIQYTELYFKTISESINNSYFLLEGKYMNLGIKMPKNKIKIEEETEFDPKGEVMKLAHTHIIVSQFMIKHCEDQNLQKLITPINQAYTNSLIDFTTLYLNRFEAETHFPHEANYLIQTSLWLIENYLKYKQVLEQRRLKKKKQKKRQYRAKRSQQSKKERIKKRKLKQKQIRISENQPEIRKTEEKENEEKAVEERIKERKKKSKKKKGKISNSQKEQDKTLHRNPSRTNLHPKHKQKEQALTSNEPKKQKNNKSNFQLKVEQYLQFILAVFNRSSKPFLKSLTLQYFLRFINVHFKKNFLSKPPVPNFSLSINPYLQEILKLKIAYHKTVGFHLILSRLGLKSITEEHVLIDLETGVKRYFFDRGEKVTSLSAFLKFLGLNFRKPPHLPHLLEIIYEEPESNNKSNLPFTVDNLTAIIETGKTKDCRIKIKDGVTLNTLLLKQDSQSTKRKSSQPIEQQKKQQLIKLTDYVPEGDINFFITHLITYTISRLIEQIDKTMEKLEKQQKMEDEETKKNQPIEPFNLKALIHTIHYLLRESPTLVPWIAKFKCRKIILNALKSQKLKNKDKLQKYVFSLINKYYEQNESIPEIGFLQVLLRFVSPFLLNSISALVFELTLDSTPLVLNNKAEKEGEKQPPMYVSFGSVVRQKVILELQSILFGGNPLEHIVRKAACLNLMTVLMNSRQMSKLLIQSNFISKLYAQYSTIIRQYQQVQQCQSLPSIYFTKLYIPFFLQPISILQQLNTAFHHSKQLNKNQSKLHMDSLIMLNEQSINAQIIPSHILKKNKFKSNWPYGKKQKPKRQNPNEIPEEIDSSIAQVLERYASESEEDQPEEEDSDSESEGQSNPSEELEERLAELDRMREQSYVSLSSSHGSQLLNDQWNYSNSGQHSLNSEMENYPEDVDHVIEEEIIRELNQHDRMHNRMEDQSIDNQDSDQMDEQDELLSEEEDLLDEEDEDDSHSNPSASLEESVDERSYSDYFSDSEQSHSRSNVLSPRQNLIIQHQQQSQFYQNVLDVISYQRINVVSKISKIEVAQSFNLRFFLQLYHYPQRKLQNNQNQIIKSLHQSLEELNIQQRLELLSAFKEDGELALCYHIEWNQVYRYDEEWKLMPMSEAHLSKLFTEEYGNNNRRRRNAVIVQRNAIEIMPGEWEIRQVRHEGQMLEEDLERQPINASIRIIDNEHPNSQNQEDQSINSSSNPNFLEQSASNSSQMHEQRVQLPLEIRQGDNIQRFNRQFQYGNEEISRILTELNMNMTSEEFHLLAREIQQDIIQNYYMAGAERQLNGRLQTERNPPNSPLRAEEEQRNSPNELAQGRIRQEGVDMSPMLGQRQAQPQIQAVNSQSLSNPDRGNVMQQQYRKMSMQHMAKVSKDIMQAINKQGKNNSKFYELPDGLMENVLFLFFYLNQKEHRNYPYNLIDTFCINTINLQKWISSCIVILLAAIANTALEKAENQRELLMLKELTHPERKVFLVVKVLHLLLHLTTNYSIAMNFLKINDSPIYSLQKWMTNLQSKNSTLQMLIQMFEYIPNLSSSEPLKFLIDLIENITVHHFYKSINALVGKDKADKAQSKPEQVNTSIQISEQSAECLRNMLESDISKQNLHSVSRIIMRLSLNERNLNNFIKLIKELIAKLTKSCLLEMEKIRQKGEVTEESQKQCLKIVNLMNIFFEMVISFKTYPTTPEQHSFVLSELRKIIQIQDLQILCQTAINQLLSSSSQSLQTIMGQIFECYFILYEIALATSSKPEQKKIQDNEHKHIAGLGEIKQIGKHRSTELHKDQDILLGKFNLSKLWRENIAHPPIKTFINTCIKKKLISLNQEPIWLTLGIFEVPIIKVAISTPHMLSFENKRLIFKTELKRLRKKSKYHLMYLTVHREEVFEDSYAEIMHYDPEVLKGKIKIQFKHEEGEDAGGLTREWFQLLSRKMFDPNYALFKSGSTGNTFHPSEKSYVNHLHLDYFKFIGRITGKALYDGYLLDAYFTPAFYKHILNLPITYLDMQEEDYQYFNSLKWILENSPIEDYLELNFTYTFDNFGQIQTKELLPGGADKLVTEQNKQQYVQLSSYAKMAISIKNQLEAFLSGFHDLIPHRLIKIFNEKQLEIMISGRPTVDIEDLKNNTELVNYVMEDQVIVWLFEVLESFDMELRTSFVQFVTGSSRVPVEGFKDLRGMNGNQKFNIHRQFHQKSLPRAHTCFNQLDLPNYESKQILIEKLTLAIMEGKQGFYMI